MKGQLWNKISACNLGTDIVYFFCGILHNNLIFFIEKVLRGWVQFPTGGIVRDPLQYSISGAYMGLVFRFLFAGHI